MNAHCVTSFFSFLILGSHHQDDVNTISERQYKTRRHKETTYYSVQTGEDNNNNNKKRRPAGTKEVVTGTLIPFVLDLIGPVVMIALGRAGHPILPLFFMGYKMCKSNVSIAQKGGDTLYKKKRG
jgi:hypothetical protein